MLESFLAPVYEVDSNMIGVPEDQDINWTSYDVRMFFEEEIEKSN